MQRRQGCFPCLHANPAAKDNGLNRVAVRRVVQMVQLGGPLGQDEAVPPAAQSVYDVGKDLLRRRRDHNRWR